MSAMCMDKLEMVNRHRDQTLLPLKVLAGYQLSGKSLVFEIKEIILIIIIMSLSQNIIIVYFKHITHTVVIITHSKRMGYVIILKPSHAGTNARCRRFYLLLFHNFVSICRC